MKKYITRTGATQFKPSIAEVMLMNENQQGFCLACGKRQEGVEPDARKCICECCDAAKVYGAEELVMMGLTY